MSALLDREAWTVVSQGATGEEARRTLRPPTWVLLTLIVACWIAAWFLLRGRDTLTIGALETTAPMDWLRSLVEGMRASSNWLITAANDVGTLINGVVSWLRALLSQPAFPRPYPQIGWLGVTALAAFVTLVVAGWRHMLLVAATFVSFGLLGFWADSIDTLIITAVSVAIVVVLGIPTAVLIGRSSRANAVVTPVLDVLQTFPSFTYLFPLFLLFNLGPACAVVATALYAFPPVVRIAAHGIRSVSPTALEATRSVGQTTWQEMYKVQIPLAKRTIIVGLNQSIMAALSMTIIAGYVNSPGLGIPVLQGLQVVNVGQAFVPGLAIVLMAIMLDRVTTAASERAELLHRAGGGRPKARRIAAGVAGVATGFCLYLSHVFSWAAGFPETRLGPWLADGIQAASRTMTQAVAAQSEWVANTVSFRMLNPVQSLLATSPWYLTACAVVLLGLVVAGARAALIATLCLAGIAALGLWNNAMVTLTMTLVATVFVMALALVLGTWMGRSRVIDHWLRPWLDAGQTLPAFVYLIPALALFGSTRFTAIAAAVLYAAPASIKIMADGVRGVSAGAVEAAVSAGSSRWQVISKVQLPMAKSAALLATNQGLLYVLSMVVIGGLVGAGALGYDIVAGFSKGELAGRGIAASICVVLIGVTLDHLTRRAMARNDRGEDR